MGNRAYNVINFHLTEKCNFKCSYCFAKFNNDFELDLKGWMKAVDVVENYFKKNNIKNGRINLAGGEPLLLNYLNELIDYIVSKEINVSLITNAFFLTKEKIDRWENKVCILGVSIDSLDENTNLVIGRHDNRRVIDKNNLIELLNYANKKNIKLKVNTVVSKLNLNRNISELYDKVNFDRIKILQIRINDNCNQDSMKYSITNDEFENYCSGLLNKDNKFIFETESDMDSSYIIIDSKGDLISNKNNYQEKVGNILEEDLETLIEKSDLNYELFSSRYRDLKII